MYDKDMRQPITFALIGAAFFIAAAFLTYDAFAAAFPYGVGGTGTTTAPIGQLIYGGATAYQSVGTTTVTCAGLVTCTTFRTFGTGAITITGTASTQFQIATTSDIAVPQVAYFTKTAGVTTLGSVATSSVTCSSGISCGSTSYVLNGALSITNTGVTSIVAGNGISISGATGAVTVTNSYGFPFTQDNNFNQNAVSTTTAVWFKATPFSLMASSTAVFSRAGFGTTSPYFPVDIATTSLGQSAGHALGQLVFTDNGAAANNKHWLVSSMAGNLYIGTTTDLFATSTPAVLTMQQTGELSGIDATYQYNGRISPTHRMVLSSGTTTSWTASTTNTAFSPFITMPFTGAIKQIYCLTDASFLGVNIKVNGSDASPTYFVASTTPGNIQFTSANTFTKGQSVLANFGTTTTSLSKEISCTVDFIETP